MGVRKAVDVQPRTALVERNRGDSGDWPLTTDQIMALAEPTDVETLVDSNVILDVFTDDRVWGEWSSTALAQAADRGPLVINPTSTARYPRASSAPRTSTTLYRLRVSDATHCPGTQRSWPLRAFADYRRRGGIRTSRSPDFLIGAHGSATRATLLTQRRGPGIGRGYLHGGAAGAARRRSILVLTA